MNVPSTVTAGNATSISAIGSSMTDAVEFRFWAYNHTSGVWTMVRDYATGASTTWTPPTPAQYTIQVWMCVVGSAASYDRWLNSPAVTVQ